MCTCLALSALPGKLTRPPQTICAAIDPAPSSRAVSGHTTSGCGGVCVGGRGGGCRSAGMSEKSIVESVLNFDHRPTLPKQAKAHSFKITILFRGSACHGEVWVGGRVKKRSDSKTKTTGTHRITPRLISETWVLGGSMVG